MKLGLSKIWVVQEFGRCAKKIQELSGLFFKSEILPRKSQKAIWFNGVVKNHQYQGIPNKCQDNTPELNSILSKIP